MNVIRSVVLLAALSSLASLSGCALLPSIGTSDKQQKARYVLTAPRVEERATNCGSLVIASVSAAPGVGGASLLYSTQTNQLERYAYAKWADSFPRLLRATLTQSMHASGSFSQVVSGPVPAPTDMRLDLTDIQLVHRYTDETATQSTMHLEATLRLFAVNPNALLLTKRHALVEPSAIGPESAARSTDRLVETLLKEVIAEVSSVCTASRSTANVVEALR